MSYDLRSQQVLAGCNIREWMLHPELRHGNIPNPVLEPEEASLWAFMGSIRQLTWRNSTLDLCGHPGFEYDMKIFQQFAHSARQLEQQDI